MSTPRILTIIYDLGLGGSQRAAQNFSLAYKKLGVEVAVLALHQSGPREAVLTDAGIPVFVGTQESTLAQVKSWRPSAIHVHRWGGPDQQIAAVITALKSPDCVVLETNVFSWVDDSKDRHLIDLHLHLSSWCLWRWSRAAKKLDPAPLGAVVPYLVRTETFFKESPQVRAQFRTEHGIPVDAFVFGRVGQASMGKWSPAIFDSFEKLLLEDSRLGRSKSFLLLVGAPEEMKALLKTQSEDVQKHVRIVEFLKDDTALRACYSSMDVFLHAAKIGESFGMVLAEAMLCEVPVITLSTPQADNSQLEVVLHQQGGLVVARPRCHFDAMKELRKNTALRRQLATAAPALIQSRFDGSILAPKLMEVIHCLRQTKDVAVRKQKLQSIGLVCEVPTSEITKQMKNALGSPSLADWLYVKTPPLFEAISRIKAKTHRT